MLYFIAMCTEKPINVSTAYYIKTSEILIFHIKMLKRKRLKPFLKNGIDCFQNSAFLCISL